VSSEDAAKIGGYFRTLGEIFTETANGTSEFIYVG
jgi:hypothetical protein